MKDFEKEMLAKIDAGERLDKNELARLCYEHSICDEEGYEHRWVREMESIVELDGRYFSILWMRGLTECQENDFEDQPVEVRKHTYEKIIEVTEWIPIKGEGNEG